MIRADTTAPVVNDEEKLARATTQAHKAARDGYRFEVGGLQFGQGVTGRRPWSLGLGMFGSSAYCSRDGYGLGGSGVT